MKYFTSTFKESNKFFSLDKSHVGWVNYKCLFNKGTSCIISYYYYNNRDKNELLIYDPTHMYIVELELWTSFYSI